MGTQLFGILNFTPDSFFDGGKNFTAEAAVASAEELLENGANFIDVGAEATNPFVKPITYEEEIERLTLVLPTLLKKFPGKVSLDTYHPETLGWALNFGRPMLNDVSGLQSRQMIGLVSKHGLTCIVGHLPTGAKGIPVRAHDFKIDDITTVVTELLQQAKNLQDAGVEQKNIVLDPNIGFGKSMRLNWQLLEFAKYVPDYKVMIGHSNKRFLGCDSETGELLENGQELRYTPERNVEAATIALQAGAAFLRVHDPTTYQSLVNKF